MPFRPCSLKPTLKIQFLFVYLLLAFVSITTETVLAQNAGAVQNALTFENNFFVTGDYAVGGVGLIGQANKIYNGYAVGTISMGADSNPGVAGTNNSVPAGAEIVTALVYWQTIEQMGGTTGQNGFFRPVFNGGPATGYVMQGTPVPNPNGTVYWNGSGCTTGSSTPKKLVTYVAVVTPYLRQDANGNVLAGYNNGTPQPATAQNYEVKLPSQSNGAPLTLGATLVIIYRVMAPSFPLKSIIVLDGTYSPSSTSLTTSNPIIQGFYQADGAQSKLTYIVGNGQKNNTETVSFGTTNLSSLYGSLPHFPGWYTGGEWDNVTWTFSGANNPVPPLPAGLLAATTSWPSQSTSTVVRNSKAQCVTPAAIIFSTTVYDPDKDGLPPVLKNSKGYCDPAINNGSCRFGDATDPGYVSLDDPSDPPQVGRKDMFVQLDYMVDAGNNPLLSYSPTADSTIPPQPISTTGGDVNLGVTRMQKALLGFAENVRGNNTHNVHLHVLAGNALQNYSGAIKEQPCIDFVSIAGLCSFPSPPGDSGGYVGWKGNFTDIKNQLVLNGDPAQCTGTPPPAGCQSRFQHGRKDSYRYVMLGHAPGLTEWFMGGGTLKSVKQTGNSVTFTTSSAHGPLNAIGIVYPTKDGGLTTIDPTTGLPTGAVPPTDPSCSPYGRVTIVGAITNPSLNGTYCIQSSTATTFTVNVGNSANATYTLATDPDIEVAPGYVTTTSGVSDEGGEDSLISLASWGPRATEKIIGGTIMHELGHTNALTHGGFSFPNSGRGDYTPAVETNCKANFQSVMSYTRQFDLLQYTPTPDAANPSLIDVVDYSEQSLNQLIETSTGIANVFTSVPFYFNTTWYRPTLQVGGTSSLLHCDGSPITDGAQYSLVTAPTKSLNWLATEDINFDGQSNETLKGYSDWDNINFDQVGATSSLSSTGGGLAGRGGGLAGRGGIAVQGGGLAGRGGGLAGRGGGLAGRGGGLAGRGSAEPSLSTGDSAVHPPTQLFANEGNSPRYVTLTWTKPTGITVADRYNIYRTPPFASGSPLTVQASSLTFNPATNQYSYVDQTDTCNANGYTYAVSALQQGTNNESTKTNTVLVPGQPLTGCYIVSNISTPGSAIQGQIVPISFTLTDDFYTPNNPVNRSAAITSLVAISPVSNDGTCTSVTQGRVTLVSNGQPASLGASTFPPPINGLFTFNLDTDVAPFCAGSYKFELNLDSGQTKTSSALLLGIDVTDSDSTPQVPAVPLPKATAGVFYTYQVTEHGGTPAFTWSLANGSTAPPGLTFSSSGVLSGTATDVGTFTFTVQVVDSLGNTGSQGLSILIVAPVAQIDQPVAPETLLLGGAAPTVTVKGEGFYAGSKILWNGSPLVTTFANTGQLTATGGDVTSLGTASISVANENSPNSNVDFFQVSDPITTVSFSTNDESVGTNPNAIIAADFEGDGKLDLAIANKGNGTVSILHGNGDGTFTVTATPATGNVPYSLAAGDFNNDGKLDLVVTNFNDNNVSVFRGNGDGTFLTGVTYVTGNAPASVISADFDRDGKLDLAVANQNDHTISILLGNGDGTFQAKVDYPAGITDVAGVAVGDFNGDNKLDLAVTNPSSDTLSVLLGNGNGTFQAAAPFSTGNTGDHPVAVSAVDVNRDGKLDLAVTNLNAKDVVILLGNGNGTFTAGTPVSTTTGTQTGPSAIASGDFNADGKIDLAITNQGNNTVSILLGNGNGVFQGSVEFSTGAFAEGVVAGDFIGNGRLDLAVANHGAGTVSILLQRPQVPTNLAPGAVTATQVSLTWTASVSTTVVGYNVYRGSASGGPYTQVNLSPVSGTTYDDTTVAPGTIYFYVVTAVDPHSLQSDRSGEVSATTPPLPATNLTATPASTGSVQLNWTASPTAGVTGYNVYRGTATGGPYTQIASQVATTSYPDTNLTSGLSYFYVVRAIGPGNVESANSNEASATAP